MMKFWGRILVLGSIALSVAGCASDFRGRTGASAEAARQQMAPDQRTLVLAQAESDLRERKLDAALNGFLSVLQGYPDDPRAHAGTGETYLAMGNGELALKAYEAWPASIANGAEAFQGRGIAHVLLGDEAAARTNLTKAVEADPSLWRAWNALGLINDRGRNWAQADQCYQKAAQINPGAAEIYNNRGYSLLQRGDHASAIPLFNQALRIDPTLEAARNNLTLASALQGRYEGALTAIPSEVLPTALNNVGYAALLRRDYASAELYLTRAVQSSPRYFEKANENLRWLNYLRGASPEEARAARPAKASAPVVLAPAP
ncbi:MAG TPA: tetratricopeptide repeat protein [Azospirillum sp.]|nr:tetratricopeptide repeat protein [Azospirillum sp.]